MYARSTTSRPQPAVSQLPSLTSLRGLAALWVVLFHYTALYLPRLDITGHSSLIGKGYLAVDLFFMLSGFVMTHVYYRAFCQSVKDNYRSFMVARIARLYPLHLVVLLLFIATALLLQLSAYASGGTAEGIPLTGTRSLAAAVANLFMQGLSAEHLSWNFPSWSISVEFLAYLAFRVTLLTLVTAGFAGPAAPPAGFKPSPPLVYKAKPASLSAPINRNEVLFRQFLEWRKKQTQ